MSLFSPLSTPTMVNQKGDRTTGSPLLDSFVGTPQKSNTAYLSEALAKTLTTNIIGLQRSGLQRNLLDPHFLSSALSAPASVAPLANRNSAPSSFQSIEDVPGRTEAQKNKN